MAARGRPQAKGGVFVGMEGVGLIMYLLYLDFLAFRHENCQVFSLAWNKLPCVAMHIRNAFW